MTALSRRHGIAIVVVLCALVFFVPLLFGVTIVAGDNLNQNIPLRHLAASVLFSGHLPLWNSYSWSGTPLLASFNEGILSPLSWIFGLLPANVSFLIDMWITFSVAGVAFLLLACELGASPFASLLGALAFLFTGEFTSQWTHMDMVQGIAFVVLAAYFGLKMFRAPTTRAAIGYTLGMGLSFAFVITAGAPEAMLDGTFLLAAFLGVLLFDSDNLPRSVGLLLVAAAIALLLSGAQWIPGLAFQAQSTRANLGVKYFEAGPWGPYFLPTFFMPFSMGNFNNFDVPNYFGTYNLGEISAFVPTIALFGGISAIISGRFSSFLPKARWSILAMFVVGLVLALGYYLPPLEAIEAHIPLYHLQRLPSRNMFTVDLAICLAFASSWDPLTRRRRMNAETRPVRHLVAPIIAAAICVAYVAALVITPSTVFRLFKAGTNPQGISYIALTVMAAIEGLLVVGTAYAYLAHLVRPSRKLVLGMMAIFAIQLLDFGGQTLYLQTVGYGPYNDPSTFATFTGAIHPGERVAFFDPRLRYYDAMLSAGLPELNLLAGVSSVQGYASLALGGYTGLTNSKPQLSFNPYLINGYAHHRLNLDVVYSGPDYFLTRVGPSGSATPLPTGRYHGALPKPVTTSAGKMITRSIYLGGTESVSYVTLKVPTTVPLSCVHSVSVTGAGAAVPLLARSIDATTHTVIFQATSSVPQGTELHVTSCGSIPTVNGAPALPIDVATPSTLYALNGYLAYVITPTLWSYSTISYHISIFTARHLITSPVEVPAGVGVSSVHSGPNGTLALTVRATHRFTLLRHEAYANDWFALVTIHGRTTRLPVSENRALQAVSLPSGSYRVTFAYQPSSVLKGLIASMLGVLLTAVGLWYVIAGRRPRNSASWISPTRRSVRRPARIRL
jgi:hypothetical protein